MENEIEKIFRCTRCGFCCHGETTVSLDEEDQQRMCNALGLSRDEVARRFWRVTGSTVQMKITDGHCIFYNDGCTVHKGRPWRCGEWPLHHSMLEDENNYRIIADSCPGINQDLSYDEFCKILVSIFEKNKKIKC